MKDGAQVLPRPSVSHCTVYDSNSRSSVMSTSGGCRFGIDCPISCKFLHGLQSAPPCFTAVLPKSSHANCCTTLTNRPLRPHEGRFVRVVQQLACEVFERTAVQAHNDCTRQASQNIVIVTMMRRLEQTRDSPIRDIVSGRAALVLLSSAATLWWPEEGTSRGRGIYSLQHPLIQALLYG